MVRSIMLAPLVVAALALGVGACAGDNSKKGADAKRAAGAGALSKAQLAAQANTICAEAERRQSAIAKPHTPAGSLAYYDKSAPVIADAVAKLNRLKPPTELAQAWAIYTSKQAAAAKLLGDYTRQAQAKDPAATKNLAKIRKLSSDASVAATAVGATRCAGNSG